MKFSLPAIFAESLPMIMKYFLLAEIFLFFTACRFSGSQTSAVTQKKDTVQAVQTIQTISPAINHYYLDSSDVRLFFKNNKMYREDSSRMLKFYRKHNFQMTWFDNNGLTEQANNFVNMMQNYAGEGMTDTVVYLLKVQQWIDAFNADSTGHAQDSLRKKIEVLLSAQFFSYAQRIWGGISQQQSRDLDWFIERKRLPLVALLDSFMVQPSFLSANNFVYSQYNLLKDYLAKYKTLDSTYQWNPILGKKKKYQLGETDSIISEIKKRLYLLGDLSGADSNGNHFDKNLQQAVMHYQSRMGIAPDGVIGNAFLKRINVPPDSILKTIMINMERFRWVPVRLKGNYIAVNIPEFKLHVYEDDSLAWSCNVVVGTTSTQTIIFNGNLSYIIFSPYWVIPASIIQKEILPGIAKNKNYLDLHHMEVVGASGKIIDPKTIEWSKYNGFNFPYIIRQKPGADNALGRVKFMFPNSFSIYLHDSPAKGLFNSTSRSFSHGCIRISEPERLADSLLRNDTAWTPEKIHAAMFSEKEQKVTLKKSVPVFIGYFTAFVDLKGNLNLRDDIYGHDARLAHLLFLNNEPSAQQNASAQK